MIRVVIKDGFGVVFDPDTHLRYVVDGIDTVNADNPVDLDPPTEPVWRDRPAGARCVALFEDKECERGV
jgi:hypothetical protein